MKKTLFLLMIATCSCSDLLEETPKGQVLGGFALQSVDGLESALVGAYKPWGSTWTSGFNTPATLAVLMGSDDLTTHKGSNKASFREFDQFSMTPLNDRMNGIWNGSYKAIQSANNILNNYETVLQKGEDAARVNQVAGEAFFIRAYSYYWLVRLWGKIPLLTKPEVTDEVLKIGLSEPKQIYDLIVSDLMKAEGLLANQKKQIGRVNKGSAKALLADVYLTMGGWPINDASSYAKAAAKANEVINERSVYGFGLVPNLKDLWNGVPSNGTPEEVFTLHFCGSCNWFTSNAIFGNASSPSEENGWDDYFTELNFFKNFPEGERKNVTFATTFKNGTLKWQDLATQHPYYKKFRLANGAADWQTSMQLSLIRYAHVLLTYAEAQARAEGTPNASAHEAVNAIRRRAGLAPLAGMTRDVFVNAVVQERAWEFAGEYTRWFDLVRLERVEAANAQKDPNELAISKPISKADYYLPIPASELTLNPNLKK